MHAEFQPPQATIETVFRHIFYDNIRSCGLSELRPGCLRAQYKEREYGSKSHLWAVTLDGPKSACEMAMKSEVRDLIADAVRTVDSSGSGDEELSV
jgi:hypothetical protein